MTHTTPLASPDWLALVAGIRTDPDTSTPRLVAADWLDDQGDASLSAWAEMIRLQVGLPPVGSVHPYHPYAEWCDCIFCRVDRQSAVLHEQHGTSWHVHQFGHVEGGVPYHRVSAYTRGFIDSSYPTQVLFGREADRTHLVGIPAAMFERSPLAKVAVRVQRAVMPSVELLVTIRRRKPMTPRGKPYSLITAFLADRECHRFDYGTADHGRLIRGAVRQVLRKGW